MFVNIKYRYLARNSEYSGIVDILGMKVRTQHIHISIFGGLNPLFII